MATKETITFAHVVNTHKRDERPWNGRWSPSVENTFSFLTVFRLDMDTWRIGCIAGVGVTDLQRDSVQRNLTSWLVLRVHPLSLAGQGDLARYIFTATIFPCFTCWLLACGLLSRGLPKRWPLDQNRFDRKLVS